MKLILIILLGTMLNAGECSHHYENAVANYKDGIEKNSDILLSAASVQIGFYNECISNKRFNELKLLLLKPENVSSNIEPTSLMNSF